METKYLWQFLMLLLERANLKLQKVLCSSVVSLIPSSICIFHVQRYDSSRTCCCSGSLIHFSDYINKYCNRELHTITTFEKNLERKFSRLICKLTSWSGNFATVYLGVNKSTGEEVAIKVVDKKKFAMNPSLRKDQLQDEVNVMKALFHPNILAIKDLIENEDYMYLILEL